MADTSAESEDIVTPLKKSSRRPSSPKSKASTPVIATTPISSSTLNLNEKPEEKRSHSIWGIFSKKHQPPSSLDVPAQKASTKSKGDSTTTPSGSLSFLHKFSFNRHSPTTPHSSFPGPYPESTLARPTELLFPVKELDSSQVDDITPEPPEDSDNSLVQIQIDPPASPEKLEFTESETTRETTIKELEQFLSEFRSGKLRALSDTDLEEMRNMHRTQLEISTLQVQIHNQLLQMGEDNEEDFDELYKKLETQLDQLHDAMENFGSLKPTRISRPVFTS